MSIWLHQGVTQVTGDHNALDQKKWPQSAKVSYFPTCNHSWPARKNADRWQWSNHKQWCTDRDPIKSSIFKSKWHLECLDTSSQFEFHKQLYGLCPWLAFGCFFVDALRSFRLKITTVCTFVAGTRIAQMPRQLRTKCWDKQAESARLQPIVGLDNINNHPIVGLIKYQVGHNIQQGIYCEPWV